MTENQSPLQRGRGFTLMELLLVLTIIAIIGSIAIPSLDKLMERQKLRSSAEEMRLAWEGARLKAMRTGQAQVFKCEIESNTYSVEPLMLHDDVNNIGDGATMMNGGTAVETTSSTFGMTTTAADTSSAASQSIDEALKFASCIVSSDMRAYTLAQSGESAVVTAQSINQSVIFYPDGTTSTAEIKVRNDRGDTVGVQIRGLTGHTRLVAFAPGGDAAP